MADFPVLDTKDKYGLSVNLHDFGQSIFEDYQMGTLRAAQKAFVQFGSDGGGVTATAYVRGETVRTALRLKIVTGVTLEEVAAAKPYAIEWLADLIKSHVTKVVTAPADPN